MHRTTVMTLILALGTVVAQPRPAFEVATIKPNSAEDHRMMIGISPGGRFNATGVTLKLLLSDAYGIQDYQVSGGPAWLNSDRYDIAAKAEESVSRDQIRLMLRTLLEDRFKLTMRHEIKELQVYSLVAGKNGPSLHTSEVGCPARGQDPPPPSCGSVRMARNELSGEKVPVAQLAAALSRILQRPVRDKTGITGPVDFELKWTPDETQARFGPGDPGQPLPDSAGPSIFTAVQEQLGLKLESQKGPVEMLYIDHAERPEEN